MRLRKYVLFIFLIALLFQGCGAGSQANAPSEGNATDSKTAALVIHVPDQSPYSISEIAIENEVSVRDLMLKAKTIDASFQFTDTLYATMGHLLTSILAVPNAKGEGAYWQFCVENTASDRGIDEKMVAPGQQVDWHFVQYGELPCKKIGE